jgi:hypothetical protein
MSRYTAISPHASSGNHGSRHRWQECHCDAGKIGAKHCRFCDGKGWIWVERVKAVCDVRHPIFNGGEE